LAQALRYLYIWQHLGIQYARQHLGTQYARQHLGTQYARQHLGTQYARQQLCAYKSHTHNHKHTHLDIYIIFIRKTRTECVQQMWQVETNQCSTRITARVKVRVACMRKSTKTDSFKTLPRSRLRLQQAPPTGTPEVSLYLLIIIVTNSS